LPYRYERDVIAQIVIMAATISVDWPARGLLAGAVSEVASERPGVLHIRLDLPEN